MGNVGVERIQAVPLCRIATTGGDVLHALKHTELAFAGFGEAYFSWIDYAAVKAWKQHTRMTMNLVVPFGQVRFVFRDEKDSPPRVEEIGDDRYVRLTVPPGIWFGFQGIAAPRSLILNIASIEHSAPEVRRNDLDWFPYDWNL